MIDTLESVIEFGSKSVRYIPALGISSLTPFFDSVQKWFAKEGLFKPKLTVQAGIQQNFRVLDLGCGTGALTLLVKKNQPSADVTGIDIDPDVLNIAKEKAASTNMHIKFDLGTAFKLPYRDNSFDRVVSSLVFHHLTRENKLLALIEVRRVLKTTGEIHIADMGKPQNTLMRLPSAIMRRTEEAEDNIKGMLPQMLSLAGFNQVEETAQFMTIFGTISLYKGLKIS